MVIRQVHFLITFFSSNANLSIFYLVAFTRNLFMAIEPKQSVSETRRCRTIGILICYFLIVSWILEVVPERKDCCLRDVKSASSTTLSPVWWNEVNFFNYQTLAPDLKFPPERLVRCNDVKKIILFQHRWEEQENHKRWSQKGNVAKFGNESPIIGLFK